MKIKINPTILGLIFMVVSSSYVFAASGHTVEGEATLQGRLVNVSGDEAKFGEYTDSKSGLYGGMTLNYDSSKYFMRFGAEDILYKTQKYSLDGGMWGKFSYKIFYSELPHNITNNARTFYSGAGGASLSVHGDPGDRSTWSSFDYKTERKRLGAGFSLDLLKPFFLTVAAETEKKDGIKPSSFGSIHSGESLIELPEPVNYRTDSFRVEAGYGKKPLFFSVSYLGSKFTNRDRNLLFENVFGSYDSVSLPPDNKYYKLAFKGALWLPYNSKLSLNIGTARSKSHYEGNDVTTIVVEPFNGKVDTKNADLALTSNPVSYLDGKVFYSYFDRDNRSEGDGDHLGFTNNTYGGRLTLKLPQQLRLTLGYTRKGTDYHERFDAKSRKDDIYAADLAWSKPDFVTLRLGYELMKRNSDRSGTDAVEDYDTIWRFDVAPADRNTFKASADLFLVKDLSLTVGYRYMRTDYRDSALPSAMRGLGLHDYNSDQFFVDAGYAIAKLARVYGYFAYERVKSSQSGHSSLEDTDWSLKQRERNFDFSVGTDVYVIPKKLTLKASYDYVRSDGSADFAYLPAPTPSGMDINSWGDYRKRALTLKAIYDITKSLGLNAGYIYERYRLNDDQLSGYSYTPDATAYLTGAYKGQSYRANVMFLSLTYRF